MAATDDVDALLALEADCVIYSPIFADPSVVVRILESGKNIVTPLGWFYPRDEESLDVDAVCPTAGVTLHGTGIHPGGITERFPLMVSALSRLDHPVRAEEFSDIRTYGAPDVVGDMMLFGKTPEEARTSIMAEPARCGLPPVDRTWSADELGFDLDPEPAPPTRWPWPPRPIDSPIGPIEPGRWRPSGSAGKAWSRANR